MARLACRFLHCVARMSSALNSPDIRDQTQVAGLSLLAPQHPVSVPTPPTSGPSQYEGVIACRLDQLTDEVWRAWQRIRSSSDIYQLPFFAPEFARAVDAVRGDVQVAMIQRGGEIVGLLPHHRIGRVAYPVGRFFNDAHNFLQSPGASLKWMDVLASL